MAARESQAEKIKAHGNECFAKGKLDAAIEAWGAKCFAKCPAAERTDHRSKCYNVCFAAAVNGNTTAGLAPMPLAEIIRPFELAFASADPAKGGCPDLRPDLTVY